MPTRQTPATEHADPVLEPEAFSQLTDRVRERLIELGRPPDRPSVTDALAHCGVIAGPATTSSLVSQLRHQLSGAGPLQPLLERPGVTDVLVNGPNGIWVNGNTGLQWEGTIAGGEPAVRTLALRLAIQAGKRLDEASPFVDARLPDGVRLHAALGTVAHPGTLISLRTTKGVAFGLTQLTQAGMVSRTGENLLRNLVSERISFMITGGTGSGKTTLLGAMLGEAPPSSRILIVEESTELRVDHPHAVSLEGRPPNSEGVGRIDLTDLVRQAMRMRPDRIVVGEVRGPEVRDLLSAMNTGHEGCAGTVHANSAAALPQRLEALGLTAGLSTLAIHSQIAAGLQAILHLHQDPRGHRRLADISAVELGTSGVCRVRPIWDLRDARPRLRHPGHPLAGLAKPRGVEA